MAKEQLDKFISSVYANPTGMREAVKGAQTEEEADAKLYQYAKANGYDFTLDEGKAWLSAQREQRAGGELNDAQLEAVAGGDGKNPSQPSGPLTAPINAPLSGYGGSSGTGKTYTGWPYTY